MSTLDEKGRPQPVERVFMAAPGSRIGPLTPDERSQMMRTSIVAGVYDQTIDRESAYEKLRDRSAEVAANGPAGSGPAGSGPAGGGAGGAAGGRGKAEPAKADQGWAGTLQDAVGGILVGKGRSDSVFQAAAKTAARDLSRALIRGVLGSFTKPRR